MKWKLGKAVQTCLCKDYKKVPIAVMSGGTVVGGSTEIVDAVLESEARLNEGIGKKEPQTRLQGSLKLVPQTAF